MSSQCLGRKTKIKNLSDLQTYSTRGEDKKEKENLTFTPLPESLTVPARLHTALGLPESYFSRYCTNVRPLPHNAALSLWYPYSAATRRYVLHLTFLPSICAPICFISGERTHVGSSFPYSTLSSQLSHNPVILSKERDDGIVYALQIPLPFPLKQSKLQSGAGITVLFRNRTSDSFSRSCLPFSRFFLLFFS
jgi:hypothetical protein